MASARRAGCVPKPVNSATLWHSEYPDLENYLNLKHQQGNSVSARIVRQSTLLSGTTIDSMPRFAVSIASLRQIHYFFQEVILMSLTMKHARIAIDHVQITADNTDVTNGRLKPPSWAKWVYIQLASADTDWTYSVTIAGTEYARNSAPDISAADNVEQSANFGSGSFIKAPLSGPETEVKINVDVVTAGVGVVFILYAG